MRLAAHVAGMGDKRNAYGILTRRPETNIRAKAYVG
jgi:hypothetical protein